MSRTTATARAPMMGGLVHNHQHPAAADELGVLA